MNKLRDFLRSHDRYFIISHARPDGDTLGSAAALCLILRAIGKEAYVAPNPEVTPKYSPFVKPYYAPTSYRYETVLTVDTASRGLLPEPYRNIAVDCRIDHHPAAEGYALLEYTEPGDAACGETVFRVAGALGVSLTPEIAALLYLAISTDTACFRYSNTTAETHRIAALLLDTGFDRFSLDEMVFFSRGRAQVAIEAAALRGLRFFADGAIAVNRISLSMMEECGAAEDDLENISSLPRDIDGVSVGLTIREERDGCKISLRTAAPYAANTVCAALGGGGHARAAGCRVAMNPAEAEAAVLDILTSNYPGLKL